MSQPTRLIGWINLVGYTKLIQEHLKYNYYTEEFVKQSDVENMSEWIINAKPNNCPSHYFFEYTWKCILLVNKCEYCKTHKIRELQNEK